MIPNQSTIGFAACQRHHHIIIISILEPCFLYRGLGFLTSLSRRRPLHSERFWGSAESIPSFFLSFSSTSSHDFLGLPDLFCATTFILRTSAIQPVLRSTCPNHLILLVRSTTSKSWMPSFVRRESELTSSFALTLQIHWIMARSLRRRRFSVSTFMGQMAVSEKGKQLAELAPCTFAACDRSQLAATSCREHVPKVAEFWDNFKLFVSNLNLWNFSFIFQLSNVIKKTYITCIYFINNYLFRNFKTETFKGQPEKLKQISKVRPEA